MAGWGAVPRPGPRPGFSRTPTLNAWRSHKSWSEQAKAPEIKQMDRVRVKGRTRMTSWQGGDTGPGAGSPPK